MARIELENRFGVALHRVLFTGMSYGVEPPATVPPGATVFWQTEETGSVTYSTAAEGSSGGGAPTETDSTAPTSPREAVRPFTLTWQLSAGGRLGFSARDVATGLRVEHQSRGDGVRYTVSRKRSRRTPVGPRRRRVIIGTSLLSGLLLLATIAGVLAYGHGGLGPVRDLFGTGVPWAHQSHPAKVVQHPSTPQLSLTASQPNIPVGETVTLTATANTPIPAGYEVDFATAGSPQVKVGSACKEGTVCEAPVQSASSTTISYQAILDTSYLVGALATSNTVSVTWIPPRTPTIQLMSSPSPDATGTVHVNVGTAVTLSATTNLAVDSVHYQIAFYTTGGSQVGSACAKGKSCATVVASSSAGTVTYMAYADPIAKGGLRVPSSRITVVWSQPVARKGPPPPPPTVTLTATSPFGSGGNLSVMIGVAVKLTATTSGPVDSTGYQIDIYDTNGNQIGSPCKTGSSCSATVSSSSAAGNVYLAHVEKSHLSGVAHTSNAITVSWFVPTVDLSASSEEPGYGAAFTLTATSSTPVDQSGYVIQLSDLTDGIPDVGHCASGSTCAIPLSCPNGAANIEYQAYIDKGNPGTSVAPSSTVTVHCPPPPLPTSITLSLDSTTTLAAQTDTPVDTTGYEIQIFDVTDNNTVVATCTSGNSCVVDPPWPGHNGDTYYQACVDQGNPSASLVCSNQVDIDWDIIF
jgi:hypothetical protein